MVLRVRASAKNCPYSFSQNYLQLLKLQLRAMIFQTFISCPYSVTKSMKAKQLDLMNDFSPFAHFRARLFESRLT